MPPALPRISRGDPITAAWANSVSDGIRSGGLLPRNGQRAHPSPEGTLLLADVAHDQTPSPYRSLPFPYGQRWLWGLKIVGAEVTIYPGYLRRGGATHWSVETAIEIAADGAQVVWQFDPSDNALTVLLWEEETDPQDHDGLLVGPLYVFGFHADPDTAYLTHDYIHGGIYPSLFAETD